MINLTTEEDVNIDTEEVVESEVLAEDLEQNVEVEESVEVVEVETVEEIDVGIDEAVGWVGGDSTRHYSLYGRDEPDQHPITAITGLREELNDIEALGVVYSDKRNQADYYLWEDGNVTQENRAGYFVSVCSGIDKIKLCDANNDIFGVTVDGAGFIGAQDDIARDIKYGLVVTNGVVHVRCESDVAVGDYVVSNAYGYATKHKSGYKVVGVHDINGERHAEITLITPIGSIRDLVDDVDDLTDRIANNEKNITASMNLANAAFNKAGEVGEISEEAIKNALEALEKANGASEKTDDFEGRLENANKVAEEAKDIANLATTDAISISNKAVERANDAWAKSDNVATEFQSLTASIDDYSVGEYSQAYGLTLEQAASILEIGMIYIPTKHLNSATHSETYLYTDDNGEQQKTTYYFTPGNYYEWNGSIWVEYSNAVAFFSSDEPSSGDSLKYWYIDSNDAPEGYEPHALYIVEDGKWVKVNTLAGNVNNRITSMIWQVADEISLEIANARGSSATLGTRITETESVVENTALWSKGSIADGEELYNIATMRANADDDGSSLALVVADTEGNKILKGASIVLGQNEEESYIHLDADNIQLEGYITANKTFSIDLDGSMTAIGGTIGGWEITENGIRKTTPKTFLEGYPSVYLNSPTTWGYGEDESAAATEVLVVQGIKLTDHLGNYTSDKKFILKSDGSLYANTVDLSGNINAESGTIGGWEITSNIIGNKFISEVINGRAVGIAPGIDTDTLEITSVYSDGGGTKGLCFWAGAWWQSGCGDYGDVYISKSPFRVYSDGSLYASIGNIGGWTLNNDYIGTYGAVADTVFMSQGGKGAHVNATGESPACVFYSKGNFAVDTTGKLYATGANISGHITATSGSFSGTLNAGTLLCSNSLRMDNWDTSGYSRIVTSDASAGITFRPASSEGTLLFGGGYLAGTWKTNNSVAVTSDKHKKNTISNIDTVYENFFDLLRPVTYKYNDGTSDRLHTGFIAQDVADALNTANIDSKDFAGLVIFNQGEEDELWTLRYEEFIALNTAAIQKLKSRVAELEDIVAKLQEKEE